MSSDLIPEIQVGTAMGGTTNKSRPSSEEFELNICKPETNSQNGYVLETRQEVVGQPFSVPDDAIFALKEVFGESFSGKWRGFQIKYNERSGKYYSSTVDQDQLVICSSKFKSES